MIVTKSVIEQNNKKLNGILSQIKKIKEDITQLDKNKEILIELNPYVKRYNTLSMQLQKNELAIKNMGFSLRLNKTSVVKQEKVNNAITALNFVVKNQKETLKPLSSVPQVKQLIKIEALKSQKDKQLRKLRNSQATLEYTIALQEKVLTEQKTK